MIVAGSTNPLLLSQATGYNLTRSLRFRNSATAYLNRTPSSNGNRKTFTWSGWVKRGAIAYHYYGLFGAQLAGSSEFQYLRFGSNGSGAGAPDDNIEFGAYNTASTWTTYTNSSFRDCSAWYHIVLAVDTTQATAANRVKIYINNVLQTTVGTYPPQNNDTYFNSTTYGMGIGDIAANGSQTFDGYLTEINFIDGQALTPSSFGETSSTTGVWQPKKYSGTYGTNGFYLPFTDNSALTSGSNAGLGKDFSGNGNYWNTNNISITSGSTYDSMTDVPTLTSATAANFCTLNSTIRPYPNADNILNANLRVTNTVGSNISGSAWGTIPVTSGKWYAECTVTTVGNWSGSSDYIGVSNNAVTAGLGTYNGPLRDAGYTYVSNGQKSVNGTNSSYGATYTTGDVIGIALDAGAGTIEFYKNGTSQGVAFTSMTNTGGYLFGSTLSNNGVHDFNFGQRPFAYTPPTGYVALNTFNLPTPTIGATASSQANKYFDISLYTGNGTTQTVTNSGGFQPALVFGKSRSTTTDPVWIDIVRGGDKQLYSNYTSAELTNANGITSFNSNGYTTGAFVSLNNSGSTYVAWQWAGNGTGSSNTAGSITSTVSANTTSGFSVVTYTGNGSTATVGHGLGVAPKFVIVKSRSLGSTNWVVYTTATGSMRYAYLNSTSAGGVPSESAPTSSVFSVSAPETNTSSATYVAYCFAEIAGFSKFGSYTGNGSSDGPFIYTGFRPAYVLIKRTDSTGYWVIMDNKVNPYNTANTWLLADSSTNEGVSNNKDFLSNGFKLRNSDTSPSSNISGGTYIYMAFAENPFKYSLAR